MVIKISVSIDPLCCAPSFSYIKVRMTYQWIQSSYTQELLIMQPLHGNALMGDQLELVKPRYYSLIAVVYDQTCLTK